MLYADANASMPVMGEVKKYLNDRFDGGIFANPSALHSLGRQIHGAIEKSRSVCADVLGARPENICFISGASEGIAAIFHSVLKNHGDKKRIVLSSIEHEAVMNTAGQYSSKGFFIDKIPVDANGVIELSYLREHLNKFHSETSLVSVMSSNNETGVLQPVEEIAKICRHYSIPFFSDTTQSFGKENFKFSLKDPDYAVLSGHKVGALPGTGILLVKNPAIFEPLIPGAGQESHLRGGTENYIGIETLAIALNCLNSKTHLIGAVEKQRMNFERKVREYFPGIYIAGEKAERLCNTTMISYPGIHGQAVQIELEEAGIYVTTTSACRDNEPQASHVLMAMGIPDPVARGVVRISMILDEKIADDYDFILKALTRAYRRLGKIGNY